MPRRLYITVRGLKRTIRNLKKVDANIKGPVRKQMLQEMGQREKRYAQEEIQKFASASGNLLKSMHYRVFPDRVSIWNDAGIYAASWNTGMRPHFIHRDMISEAGYSVGDWMDANNFSPNRKYVLVGAGTPIGRGIRYMDIATEKLKKAMPNILDKYSKMMLR